MIKSHGRADTYAFTNAIKQGAMEAKTDVSKRIREQVANLLGEAV